VRTLLPPRADTGQVLPWTRPPAGSLHRRWPMQVQNRYNADERQRGLAPSTLINWPDVSRRHERTPVGNSQSPAELLADHGCDQGTRRATRHQSGANHGANDPDGCGQHRSGASGPGGDLGGANQ